MTRNVLVGILLALLATNGSVLTQPVSLPKQPPKMGPPLETIVETEQTARLLAILLDSGRYVINENQELFDDPIKGEKGFTPQVFEQQLTEVFRSRAGIDLQELPAGRLSRSTKDLLTTLVTVSKQVVAEAQSEINRKGKSFKGFIPAVFGGRVASRFSDITGVRLKQTALSPRNPANAPDLYEKSVLQVFADPSYPREKVISEVAAKSKSLRLMFPLYATRQCLNCHGEPKGELDKTGHQREGLHLGQNAGAISVVIPIGR